MFDLNIAEFEGCLATEKYRERVQANMTVARELEITGVPGFVIGRVAPENPGSVKGISFVRGAQSFSNFQKEIETALVDNN